MGWKPTVRTLDELYERCEPEPNTNCWLWTGDHMKESGYGRVQADGVRWLAHRYAFHLSGVDLGEHWVLHKCDTTRCCNPEHLFLGDHPANMKDMAAKGRGRKPLRKYFITCEVCGAKKQVTSKDHKRKRTCSRQCAKNLISSSRKSSSKQQSKD